MKLLSFIKAIIIINSLLLIVIYRLIWKDDDFAINLNENDEKMKVPTPVCTALATSSLLFVGYRLEDITFRVIFQGVIRMLGDIRRPFSIAVQVLPLFEEKAMVYLNQYTKNLFETNICLTSLEEFVSNLREKWNKYPKDS